MSLADHGGIGQLYRPGRDGGLAGQRTQGCRRRRSQGSTGRATGLATVDTDLFVAKEGTRVLPTSFGIELRHLRYFLAVFEELHFGRAAERLHIAQPPLSQAIRKLERELGVQLFVRTSRAVEPTPAGIALAEEARPVLASFQFALSEARRAGRGNGLLQIGCASYLPHARLQLFLEELKKRDPDFRAEVTHLLGVEQVDRMVAGQLDLGVLIHAEDYPELDHEPMFPSEQVFAFLPGGHRLAEKTVLRPDDLSSETLLMYPRAANPALFDFYLARVEQAGFRFRGVHENGSDARDMLLAVATGVGIAFGPRFFAEISEEGQSVIRRPIDTELRFPDVSVAWRANAPRRLRGQIAHVREAARKVYQTASAAS